MDRPRNFGSFLLFKESEANAYRTSYRAGVSRGRTIDRIVRIEVFDGPEVDAGKLAASLGASQSLQERLKDPHIARGAGLGLAGDVPYAAYDFELGVTLSSFLALARSKSFPMPFDQALFIVERIALALAAGYRVEHNGSPVHHTFLTPDSVLLSSQGEVKVLGFETAAGLREQFSAQPAYASYLAPECRAGGPPGSRDDVYSLGAILFELVSGRPYAPDESGDGPEGLVVQATGERISDGLRRLLEASFAPRSKRTTDVLEWQQNLGKLILAGEYNPTTFNLAFLMHTIMRDRLEQDVSEIRREKRFLLTRETESELAAEESSRKVLPEVSESAPEETVTEPVSSVSASLSPPPSLADPTSGTDRKPFWLGFAVSALVGGGVLGALLASGGPTPIKVTEAAVLASTARPDESLPAGGGLEPRPQSETRPAAGPTSAESASLVLTEVVNGELGAPVVDEKELERQVAERASEIERNLKAEYESKLARRGPPSGEPAQVAGVPAGALDAVTPGGQDDGPRVATGASAANSPPPNVARGATKAIAAVGSPSASEPLAGNEGNADTAGPLFQVRADAQADRNEASTDAPAGGSVQVPVEVAPLPVDQEATAVKLSALKPTKIPTPAKALVTDPPRLLRLGTPNYPPVARRLGLSARVRVKVRVGLDGKVVAAEIVGPETGNGFDTAALATVRRSRWAPGTKDGEPVDAWTSVTIEFRP